MIKFPDFMFLSNEGIIGTLKILDVLIELLSNTMTSFLMNFKVKYLFIEQTSVGLDLWGLELNKLMGEISKVENEKNNMSLDNDNKLRLLLLFLLIKKNIDYINNKLPIDSKLAFVLKDYKKDYYIDFLKEATSKTNFTDLCNYIKKYFFEDIEFDEKFLDEIKDLDIKGFLDKLNL